MNTFGPSSYEQYPLHDVREVLYDRRRFRRGPVPNLLRVNHFYCPVGRWPSRGWVLLTRKDYNQFNKYSNTLHLSLNDTTKQDNVRTLKNISIVQAQCVTRGLEEDENALYLVELTDGRGILHNQWFQFPLNTQYNIRAPAYPATFHPQSMNGGTTWTWSTMLQNIWETMSQFLGTWPGLPVTPAGTPEGFWFNGVPALYSMCDILDHLGMTLACDLTQDDPFTIVKIGAADTTFAAAESRYVTNLEDDLEWIDVGAGRTPGTVRVLFRKRYEVFGTEETARRDSPQWDMTSIYTVIVTAPAEFSGASGVHYLQSDFTVRHDMNGDALAADVATANTIAQERVDQYFQTLEYMTRTYTGALPFATGSKVDGVCWYMGTGYLGDGWRTQIVRGPSPPWPEIWNQS